MKEREEMNEEMNEKMNEEMIKQVDGGYIVMTDGATPFEDITKILSDDKKDDKNLDWARTLCW